MSRLVSENQWYMWCGDMPMPEGATYDMMMAASKAIEEMERRDEAVEGIATFSEFLERDKKRLWEAEQWGDTEKAELIKNTIKITEQIINTYRSWLE